MTRSNARRAPSRRSIVCGANFVAGFAVGMACTSTTKNGEHCFYNDGNATCAARYGTDLPYCGIGCAAPDGATGSPNGDGCVSWEPTEACYSPCGGERDITDDSTCLDSAGTEPTTSPSEPTDTGPGTTDDADTTQGVGTDTTASETGPTPCSTSGDCMASATPICIDDVCVPCTASALPDAECAAKDPDLGLCGAAGNCVQCTALQNDACFDATPVCRDEACDICLSNDECDSGACQFATGECFSQNCTLDVPADFDTLQAAVDEAVMSPLPCVVRVTDDVTGFDLAHTVTIGGGMTLAIIRGGGAAPFRITGGAAATVQVTGGATVYLTGLRIAGNPDDFGVRVAGAGSTLYVDAAEVVDNDGGGISVETGAHLLLTNAMVGGAADGVALAVSGTSRADILYSTIVGATGDAAVLVCPPTATVTARNSVLVGRGPDNLDIQCDADVTYSASEVLLDGTGNIELGVLDATSQADLFVNYGAANFHLVQRPPVALITAARWQDGDPLGDIDGDPRPATDGTMDVAGADVP